MYAEYLKDLADNQRDRIFVNSGKEYAIEALINIFDHSNQTISIYVDKLSNEVTEDYDYIESLIDFVRRGSKLKILIHTFDKDSRNSSLFSKLRLYNSYFKNVDIRRTKIPFSIIGKGGGEHVNFTIGDDKMFRLETIETGTAYGCFNMPDIAKMYSEKFNERFDNGTKLNLFI